jgi:hypothetical protein
MSGVGGIDRCRSVSGAGLVVPVLLLLWASHAVAADKLTREMIQQVIETADAAALQRDTKAIGDALGSGFYKYIDVPSDVSPATARIDKQQYLNLIEQGWKNVGDYQYQRQDLVIHLSPDGDSGESFSTITERFSVDGKEMTSKVREYARYQLENGRPVIVNIDNQTLAGDTTP